MDLHGLLPMRDVPDVLAGEAAEADLRGDYEALRAVLELAQRRPLDGDLEALLPALVEAVARVVPAGRVVLLLASPTGELVPRCTWPERGEPVVLLRRELEWVHEAEKAVWTTSPTAAEGGSDALCAPLVGTHGAYGVVWASARDGFTGEDLRRFAWGARRVAAMIAECQRRRASLDCIEERVRLAFQFPPDLIESILHGRPGLAPGGAWREVTALVVDLRDRLTMARHGTARPGSESPLSSLNRYHEAMIDAVVRWRGVVDLCAGDSLLALFGAPIELADAPLDSIRCALDMRRALAELAGRADGEAFRHMDVAIGVATGPALVGAIGTAATRRYTAIGAPVTGAARLSRYARASEILVDEETRRRVAELAVERRVLGEHERSLAFSVRALEARE